MLRKNKRSLIDDELMPEKKKQKRSALESSLRKTLRGKMSKQDLKFGFEVLGSWNLETKQGVFKLSHKSFAKLIKPMPSELISVLQQFRSDSQATKQKLFQREQRNAQHTTPKKPIVEKRKKRKTRQNFLNVRREEESEPELRDTLLEEAEFCFQIPDLASLEPIPSLPDLHFRHSRPLKLDIPELNPFAEDDVKEQEEPQNPFLEKKDDKEKCPANPFLELEETPKNPFAEQKKSVKLPISHRAPSKELIIKIQSQFTQPLDYKSTKEVLTSHFKEKVKMDDMNWTLSEKERKLFLDSNLIGATQHVT